ncbi:MAG: hypothetical protein EOO80_16105 [Oxalobacteraceae bacterium]|nr:MAG: hypothetical protein EOO80_16105 [Oxalobacteraceae bacterium]
MSGTDHSKTLEQLMADYAAGYSQEVRDLAETLCASTTRLAVHGEAVRPSLHDVRRTALERGIDEAELVRAVNDYAQIETAAEARYKQAGRAR